jgi:predicted enzyme related to lactoylglutathione lyase
MRLAQAVLFVADTARMMDFYTEAFGLTLLDGDPADGFVRLDAGGVALALHALRNEPRSASGAPPPREDSHIKLAFHVDDIEAVRDQVAAKGAVMRDIHRFGDVAFCDGIDPEGNVFQITTR